MSEVEFVLNSSFWPGICAFFCVLCAALVLIDSGLYIAGRYRERYLREATTGLDDVLIQMPPRRVFDLGLALSAAGGCAVVLLFAAGLEDTPWQWGLLIGAAVALALFPVPLLVLRFLKRRRLDRFNIQLEDALGMISSSLKAGFSINQALEEVAELDIRPVSVEFRLLTQEIRLGVPLEQALENMNRRLESDDFALVATAILTARQTGGELTATLERVASLIRERVRISNKVRALTAMGRMQALLIGLMPPALFLGMYHINPVMMRSFLHSPLGIIGIILMVLLDIAGYWMIRKIVSIEV